MRKSRRKLLGAGFAVLAFGFLGFQIQQAPATWQKPLQPSLAGGALTCLTPHPIDRSKFLVASGQQIFEAGKENAWLPLWSQTDPHAPITRLFSFPSLPDIVFAINSRQVFMGNLKDRSWRVVYKDSGRAPRSFAIHPQNPNHWFLGTQRGLLETTTAGKTWSPASVFHASKPVSLVAFVGARLFLAGEKTLYLAQPEGQAQAVLDLAVNTLETTSEEKDSLNALEEPLSYNLRIHDLLVSKRDPQELFLATDEGVFRSLDSGYRWLPLPNSGLQSASILQLAYSSKGNRLYAATPRGVYAYDSLSNRWIGLFQGLAKDKAQGIAVLGEEKLIAITNEGFVQYPLEAFVPETNPSVALYQPTEETLALLKELVSREPSAREVHQHVIRYADVSNGKIKRWHALSRTAGLLPSLSFGKSLNRNDSVTTYSGKYITGPEDVSKSWDADVSWDLGAMIYSSDQTSIDSREKMMVELRNDLLSEATRIYYERRRLQIDLVFTPSLSEQEHLQNLLRLDELSALLDGMTDGFFSQQLEGIYAEKPALNKLWGFQQKDGGGRMAEGERNSL